MISRPRSFCEQDTLGREPQIGKFSIFLSPLALPFDANAIYPVRCCHPARQIFLKMWRLPTR